MRWPNETTSGDSGWRACLCDAISPAALGYSSTSQGWQRLAGGLRRLRRYPRTACTSEMHHGGVQEEHRKNLGFADELKRFIEKNGVEYDPKYLFE